MKMFFGLKLGQPDLSPIQTYLHPLASHHA